MFKIFLPQLNKVISVNTKDSLMNILLDNDVPVASSCLGDAVCGKCVLNIKGNKISQQEELEDRLKVKYKWNIDQRASCQVKVLSDLTVTSTYW